MASGYLYLLTIDRTETAFVYHLFLFLHLVGLERGSPPKKLRVRRARTREGQPSAPIYHQVCASVHRKIETRNARSVA
jgi:hypothetical protein